MQLEQSARSRQSAPNLPAEEELMTMKHLLLTTIAAVVLVGCGPKAPDISIHDAVEKGNIEVVKQHLTAGTDVEVKDGEGWTLLQMAAGEGHKEIAELLIAKGADVNAKNEDGETPLDNAIIYNHPEIADLLRKHGGKTSEKLKAAGKPTEPVAEAATPEPPTAKAPDISIHNAVIEGDIQAVKQHLAAGTDVNAKDEDGWTPLHSAAFEGHKEVVALLIAEGADVNAMDGGFTPLHYAAWNGHKEVAELLIENGAEVNAKVAIWGRTPLHLAAFYGRKEVVALLIAKGADVNAMDGWGMTPLDLASGVTAELLRTHGGMTGEELKALMPRLVQHGRFAFSFDAKEGKVYEVQDSFDLLNWEVIKTYTGTGASVRFDEERDHDPPKWFYRVRVVE